MGTGLKGSECSKQSIYYVHTSGAKGHRIVHPVIFLCAHTECIEIL